MSHLTLQQAPALASEQLPATAPALALPGAGQSQAVELSAQQGLKRTAAGEIKVPHSSR